MYSKQLLFIHCFLFSLIVNAQKIIDNFEGDGNISSWKGDNCLIQLDFQNPFKMNANLSAKVLKYSDVGGQYANVRFDISQNFDLSKGSLFAIKIYIPSNKISGNQANQVSLKLQDGKLGEPWSTQSEIIKPLLLDQWQTITFDFAKDNYKNINSGSLVPTQRKDFNRVVIQINGENNNDSVMAYIDDFEYFFVPPTPSKYTKLVWADEFDIAGPVNSNNWFHQTELPLNGSWYNGEIQHYTNRTANSKVENGILKVIAQKETFTDQGYTKQYTSARLNSKFAFKYGRVVFKAKLPSGIGTWPAVWMLGKNIEEKGAYWDNAGFGTTPWPACGEIDLLEHWGNNQNYVQSAIHTPSSFGNTSNLGGQTINTASTAFHLYSLEWTPNKMIFSVDSVIHYTYEPLIKNSNTWPFSAEQYLLINLAIQPNISLSFTQGALEIDYIRVYQEENLNPLNLNNMANEKIFPNPFSSQLTILTEITDIQHTFVQIYSSEGKLVIGGDYKIEENSIAISNLDTLNSGIYFLNYTLGDKIIRLKIRK